MVVLADACISLGKYDEAFTLLKQAKVLSAAFLGAENSLTLRAQALLGSVYLAGDETEQAEELAAAGLAALERKEVLNAEDRLNRMRFMTNLVQVYQKSGRHEEQHKMAKRLLEVGKIQYGYGEMDTRILGAVEQLAESGYDIGDYSSSARWSEESLRLLSNHRQTLGFSNGGLFPVNNSMLSISNIYISTPERLLARSYFAEGDFAKAAPYYEQFIEKSEYARGRYGTFLSGANKTSWFSQNVDVYKEAAAAYAKQGQQEKAFSLLELCRARSLAESYNDLLAESVALLKPEDAEKSREFRRKIEDCSRRIKDSEDSENMLGLVQAEREQSFLLAQYHQFKESLMEDYPQYVAAQRMQAVAPAQNAEALSEDSCYISFTALQDRLLCFARTRDALTELPLGASKDLAALCRVYRELLAYGSPAAMQADGKYLWRLQDGSYRVVEGRQMPARGAVLLRKESEYGAARTAIAEKLGNLLLRPLLENRTTADKAHWIFSTDSMLSSIPFETLLYNGLPAIAYADISYVPSLNMLSLMQARKAQQAEAPGRKELFAMGDAAYGTSGTSGSRGNLRTLTSLLRGRGLTRSSLAELRWSNLPGTGRELDRVSPLFESQLVYRGAEASEASLKEADRSGALAQYKYLLFAAHGIFIPEAPALSSIVLSQKDVTAENDGYVTVGEWMSFRLNSDLVYLSACESGLGEYQNGEGLVGIPYALCIAGNRDTVMSLWKVDDDVAAEFSSSFFKKLSKGMEPVKALNEVKREFIQRKDDTYSNPTAWSAFLLYGV